MQNLSNTKELIQQQKDKRFRLAWLNGKEKSLLSWIEYWENKLKESEDKEQSDTIVREINNYKKLLDDVKCKKGSLGG